MKNLMAIVLKSITYTGYSIGTSLSFEISINGTTKIVKPKVRFGGNVILNQEITVIELEEDQTLPLSIKIIEDDILYDDTTTNQLKIKVSVNTNINNSQIFSISVFEKSKLSWNNKPAMFKIEFEVKHPIRYVEDTDDKGWLLVSPKETEDNISLPRYLKVEILGIREGSEFFHILEGVNRGIHAEVSLKSEDGSRFGQHNLQLKAATLEYSLSKRELKNGSKTYKTILHPTTKWVLGEYKIRIADYPHELGNSYLHRNKYSNTWFNISYFDEIERYIHAGEVSLGCVTVSEIEKWTELYHLLLKSRLGDDLSAGILIVTS